MIKIAAIFGTIERLDQYLVSQDNAFLIERGIMGEGFEGDVLHGEIYKMNLNTGTLKKYVISAGGRQKMDGTGNSQTLNYDRVI